MGLAGAASEGLATSRQVPDRARSVLPLPTVQPNPWRRQRLLLYSNDYDYCYS